MNRPWTLLATAALLALPRAAVAQADTLGPPILVSGARATLMSIPSETVDFMVGGQIVSARDGQPVIGAQVHLVGTMIGTLTDHHGRFRLDAPAGGPVRLEVQLLGYQSLCVNIEPAEHRMLSLGILLPPHFTTRPPSQRIGCVDPEVVEPPRH